MFEFHGCTGVLHISCAHETRGVKAAVLHAPCKSSYFLSGPSSEARFRFLKRHLGPEVLKQRLTAKQLFSTRSC